MTRSGRSTMSIQPQADQQRTYRLEGIASTRTTKQEARTSWPGWRGGTKPSPAAVVERREKRTMTRRMSPQWSKSCCVVIGVVWVLGMGWEIDERKSLPSWHDPHHMRPYLDKAALVGRLRRWGHGAAVGAERGQGRGRGEEGVDQGAVPRAAVVLLHEAVVCGVVCVGGGKGRNGVFVCTRGVRV